MKPWSHVVKETIDNALPLFVDAVARTNSGDVMTPAWHAALQQEHVRDYPPVPRGSALYGTLAGAIDFDFADVDLHNEDYERAIDRLSRGVFRLPFESVAVLHREAYASAEDAQRGEEGPDVVGVRVVPAAGGPLHAYTLLHQDRATHDITCFVFASTSVNDSGIYAYFPVGSALFHAHGAKVELVEDLHLPRVALMAGEGPLTHTYGSAAAARDTMGAAAIVALAFIAALERSSLDKIPGPPPTKLNKARAKKKLPPIRPRYGVKIKLGAKHKGTLYRGGTHASPRPHMRRGHVRHLASGATTWVRESRIGLDDAWSCDRTIYSVAERKESV